MSVEDISAADNARKKNSYHFDRHTPEYREQFGKITEEMHAKCPMAWTDVYDGHWVAADSKHVFELARCPAISNDHLAIERRLDAIRTDRCGNGSSRVGDTHARIDPNDPARRRRRQSLQHPRHRHRRQANDENHGRREEDKLFPV